MDRRPCPHHPLAKCLSFSSSPSLLAGRLAAELCRGWLRVSPRPRAIKADMPAVALARDQGNDVAALVGIVLTESCFCSSFCSSSL